MGRLIPAGTGMPRYRQLGIQIEGAEEELDEEPLLEARPAVSLEEAGGQLRAVSSAKGGRDPGLEV